MAFEQRIPKINEIENRITVQRDEIEKREEMMKKKQAQIEADNNTKKELH